MSTVTFQMTDPSGLVAWISITEMVEADGNTSLHFSIDVDESTGVLGEVNGVFFDLGSFVEKNSLTTDAIKIVSDEGDVSNLGGGVNVNGEILKTYGEFDAGVLVDETGLAGNYETGSYDFSVSLDSGSLTLDMLLGQDFALRLTSVGEDGSQEGSLKLATTVPSTPDPEEPVDPENPVDPEDPVDPEPPVDPDPVHVANDDRMTVTENEMFSLEPDGFDFLDGNVTSILANDTTDGGPLTASITSVNGSEVSAIHEGSNGGWLLVYADGSVDFSAINPSTLANPFAELNDFEMAETVFTYEIEGGDTATLTVTVLGEGGFDGGGGDFDPVIGPDPIGFDGLG